jgi:hypothetical protein
LRHRALAGAVGSVQAVWKDQRETEPSDRRAYFPKKTCKASVVWLAEQTGWTRQNISKSLDKLIALKIIAKGERVAGSSYTYTLLHRYRPRAKAGKSHRFAKAS